MFIRIALASLLAVPWAALAHADTTSPAQLQEVTVRGVRERMQQQGMLKDVVEKTEIIDEHAIEQAHASSLNDAIKDSPGVRVSNECSMCGVKRVMLNGMKGEHTTVLVDGLPVHTMISGFYGLDAMPAAGIERIEVARGAGASLTAPEAIGGVINVITKQAIENGVNLDFSAGTDGFRQLGVVGTAVGNNDTTRITVIGQQDQRDQVDNDNNGVSESPLMNNHSVTFRVSQDIEDADNVVMRYSTVASDVFGGPVIGDITPGISAALSSVANGPSTQLFEDNDVRKRYIGQPWETTEYINTHREEASLSWLHQFNDVWNVTFSSSYAEHQQDSFYESFDYNADDDMLFTDARFNWGAADSHLVTFGVNRRAENMRSSSEAGDASSRYISDSFDYDVTGIYVQDAWTPVAALDLTLALRADRVRANFIDPQKPGAEIEENVVSPRIDTRYRHNDHWASRLSFGRGYRAPLSFFESDHGILDSGDGFDIDVDRLERSRSVNYSLSFTGEQLTATVSAARTAVEHLAALSTTETGVPLLTQLGDNASVNSMDLAVGYQPTSTVAVGVTAEHVAYDRVMRSSYSVAPIDDRVTLEADWHPSRWEVHAEATWIGSRDLRDYSYEGTNVLGSEVTKSASAPSYWTVDMRLAREIGGAWSVYAGVHNLFDYTQINDEDTPLFWDAVGSSDAGYDVAYIYGPLRGRETYVGLKYQI